MTRRDYLGDFDAMMPQYGVWTSPQALVEDPRFYENYGLLVVIDTQLEVRGETIGKQRFVFFKRLDEPRTIEDWDYQMAVDEFISTEGNLQEYSCEYILPPCGYL